MFHINGARKSQWQEGTRPDSFRVVLFLRPSAYTGWGVKGRRKDREEAAAFKDGARQKQRLRPSSFLGLQTLGLDTKLHLSNCSTQALLPSSRHEEVEGSSAEWKALRDSPTPHFPYGVVLEPRPRETGLNLFDLNKGMQEQRMSSQTTGQIKQGPSLSSRDIHSSIPLSSAGTKAPTQVKGGMMLLT